MNRTHLILLAACLALLGGLAYVTLERGPGGPAPPPDDEVPDGPPPVEGTGGGPRSPEAPPEPAGLPADERAREIVRAVLEARPGEPDPLGEPEFLETISDREVAEALVRVVRGSAGDNEKAAALLALGSSWDPVASEALFAAANGDAGAGLRTAALYALSRSDPRVALPFLADIALRSRDDHVAATAMQALLLLDTFGAMRVLAEALEGAGGREERRRIVYSLLGGVPLVLEGEEEPPLIREYRQGLPGLVPPMLDASPEFEEQIRKILEKAVGEKDPETLRAAAAAVTQMPGEVAREAFGELWAKDGKDVRSLLLYRLDPTRPDARFVELVRRAPETEAHEFRDMISLLLDRASDPRLLPHLLAWAAREPNEQIRRRIQSAITRLER